AIADFRELTVTDAEGNVRPASHQDLVRLVNLPLGEARKLANELFGDSSDDAMAHYRQVRTLAEQQNKALEEAKKTGSLKEQEKVETTRKLAEETGRSWQDFTSSDEQKYPFLQPREGDDEWNTKLASSREFVDKAFTANAFDGKLTPEQRAEIIRNHASVRGRAIGFSMLRMENKRLKADLAERDKVIAQYKSAEPGAADGRSAANAPVTAANRLEAIKARMRGMARPG
ncbi:MAG: hypothetical protein KJ556_20590, partial [Gammaproteobacteria bacterium]|nr:hypothetical protein [Gammaproteobacteria bacterium]